MKKSFTDMTETEFESFQAERAGLEQLEYMEKTYLQCLERIREERERYKSSKSLSDKAIILNGILNTTVSNSMGWFRLDLLSNAQARLHLAAHLNRKEKQDK